MDSVVLPNADLAARAELGESDLFCLVQQVLIGTLLCARHLEGYKSLKFRI